MVVAVVGGRSAKEKTVGAAVACGGGSSGCWVSPDELMWLCK